MTLGSLFDGSGGFPLAGVMTGVIPIWASEIEPYPLKVTAARFPNMKQYGDITNIDGSMIEPVDIITFGSPCQDLSVAGKQAGIHDGERSSLFFHAIRIIKEMRAATNGRYPRYAIWENVPGAFSSNKKEDFKAVLEAFAGIMQGGLHVPLPKKWSHAGCMVGDGWSVAWRVYDAQYWGVPQRRKRIYLIADFGSERAGEILFKRDSLSWNTEPSPAAREGAAGDTEEGIGETGCSLSFQERAGKPGGGKGILIQDDHVGALSTVNNQRVVAPLYAGECKRGGVIPRTTLCFEPGSASRVGGHVYYDGKSGTLRAEAGDNRLSVVCIETESGSVMCLNDQGGSQMSVSKDKSATLRAQEHGHQPCVCIEGNGARPSHQGNGYKESDTMYTLNTIEQHAVAYSLPSYNSKAMLSDNPYAGCHEADKARTLDLNGGNPACYQGGVAVCVGNGQANQSVSDKAGALNCMHDQQSVLYEMQHASDVIRENENVAPTLQHRMGTGGNNIPLTLQEDNAYYIVRRLTPLECCRLQGFPDWWEDGVEGSDTARYKMWGNGIALPCAVDVLQRIAEEIHNGKTGSLC